MPMSYNPRYLVSIPQNSSMNSPSLISVPLLVLLLIFASWTLAAADIPDFLNPWWEEFRKITGCRRGDNSTGIDAVKRYFNQFGYLDKSDNYTDEFDIHLEDAIRTYQENFDLNVTGILDEETVKQLSLPRCGVRDIINGSSSMNSGRKLADMGNSVAHFSFFPGNPRWSDSRKNLSYAFSDLKSPFRLAELRPIFVRSFAKWAAVTPLAFSETEDYSLADIKILFASGEHGDGKAFDGRLGTLAHAFSPESGVLHFDADEKWVIDTAGLSDSGSVDLESVAVHEIGHLLGLGHSSVKESIMFPTLQTGKKKVGLVMDDVEGIQQLYGRNPNGNFTIPSQQSEQTGAGHSLTSTVWLSSFISFIVSISSLFQLLKKK